MMKIAITGHRPNKLGNDYDLKSELMLKIKSEILRVIQPHIDKHWNEVGGESLRLITGMALGIDTLFALIAIEQNIPFIAAIPYQQQYAMWTQKSKELWMNITDNKLCEKIYVSTGPYSPQKMQLRNQWMVDHCDLLIAVWNGTPGSTKNCVEYAKSEDKPIIYIQPNLL